MPSNDIPRTKLQQQARLNATTQRLITLQVIVRASLVQHNTVGFVYYIPGAACIPGVLSHTACCGGCDSSSCNSLLPQRPSTQHSSMEATAQQLCSLSGVCWHQTCTACQSVNLPAAAVWQSSNGSVGVLFLQMFPIELTLWVPAGAASCDAWCLQA